MDGILLALAATQASIVPLEAEKKELGVGLVQELVVHGPGQVIVPMRSTFEVLARWAFVESESNSECGCPSVTLKDATEELLVEVQAAGPGRRRVWAGDRLMKTPLTLGVSPCADQVALTFKLHCAGRVVLQWILFGAGCTRSQVLADMEATARPFAALTLSPWALRIPDRILFQAAVAPLRCGMTSDTHRDLQFTDCVVWNPEVEEDEAEFIVNGRVHTRLTHAVKACVQAGIFGECRHGTCLLYIGTVCLGRLDSWEVRAV